jgi:hypothetical protein
MHTAVVYNPIDLLYSFAPQSDGSPVCTGKSKPALFLSETGDTSVTFTYSVSFSVCDCLVYLPYPLTC